MNTIDNFSDTHAIRKTVIAAWCCGAPTRAAPAAALRDGVRNMGCTEVMSPWGDAVAS